MTQYFINIISIIIAGLTVIWTITLVKRVINLNVIFNHAIVLIPLYHKKTWLFIINIMFLCFLVGAVILGLVTRYYTFYGSVIVVLICLITLISSMIAAKFAVLDSGIIVPFRFIHFMHLYEYSIEDNKVFFCKDEKGYDTINSISPKLFFSLENLNKLEYLLKKHVNKR